MTKLIDYIAADIYFVYKNYLFYHPSFEFIRIMLASVLFFVSFVLTSFQFNRYIVVHVHMFYFPVDDKLNFQKTYLTFNFSNEYIYATFSLNTTSHRK